MNPLGWLILAILAAYGCAGVAAQVRHRRRGRSSGVLSWCFVPIVLVCPLLVPSANVGLRAASAFVSGDIAFRMVDLFRQWEILTQRGAMREYFRFLVPFPVLSVVYPDHKLRLRQRQRPWPAILRILGGAAGFLLALLAVRSLSDVAMLRSNFALNHVAVLPIFLLGVESLSYAMCGLERLAGFDTTPIIRSAYLSRTPAEFWRRYNFRIHDWLYRNVYQATGGRRHPVRSILYVFLVSGLFHEVMFTVATSRLTGYQLVFFTLQGPAALASGHLARLARRGGTVGNCAARGATILFMALTSVFFFDGVRRVFPFVYAAPSPLP
jgi:hypothetical protein